MYMSAMFWHNGVGIWRVQHRGGDFGPMDLEVDGTPPDNFEEIRKRHVALQEAAGGESAGVDHIASVPRDLAQAIVGFSYDGSTYNGTIEMADVEADWTFAFSPAGGQARVSLASSRNIP
jgi:hypothetical protein